MSDKYAGEVERLEIALRKIVAVLGPTIPNTVPEGPDAEMQIALDTAQEALDSKPAKKTSTFRYKIGFITHEEGAIVWNEKWMTSAEACAFVNDECAQQRCLEVQVKEFVHGPDCIKNLR